MKLKEKLVICLLLMGLLPFILLGVISYFTASGALEKDANGLLTAIRTNRMAQIKEYFEEKMDDVDLYSKMPSFQNTLKQFYTYKKNTNKYNSEHVYNMFDQIIRNDLNLDKKDYYDIFIMDNTGQIIYAAAKEADYNTNMMTGEYKDSGLADAYREGLEKINIQDFEHYAPSNEPASFIAAPIKSNGKVIGVVAVQVSLNAINSIMQEATGLGKSGETYLVGPDFFLRSNSRLDNTFTVQNSFKNKMKVETEGVKNGLAGKSETKIIKDYRGVDVLSSFAPLKISNLNWVVLAEIDKSEAFAAVDNLSWIIGILAVVLTCVIVGFGLVIANSIVNPIKYVVDKLEQLAGGNLQIDVEKTERKDEVGILQNSARKLREDLRNLIINIKNKMDDVSASSQELQSISETSSQVINETTQTVEQMSAGSQNQAVDISESAQDISKMALQTVEITKQVQSVSEAASKSVEEVNHGQEEVENTLGKIFEIKHTTEEIAGQINKVGSLGMEIGKIVDMITTIAGQTNLLALNAAIESARAGEHGKGFAVVAEEVKKLAEESAEAANQIKDMIEQIQIESNKAVASTEKGVEVVGEGVEAVNIVKKAFENILYNTETGESKSKEIFNLVEDLNLKNNNVSSAMENISSATEEAAASAEEIAASMEEQNASMQELSSSASMLASLTQELNDELSVFKV